MKGIEKKIDKLGRIVLPKSYLKRLGLNNEDCVLISLESYGIIISPNKVLCALCGTSLSDSEELRLCELCISKVKNS